ncbi:hypothetical protein BJY04DRAFT_217630 [Aspergillus karnatakaensis]|uniref:uncharacterized protein n=1 Tax=Aspergillus karnatakaensis TaxID=1810916 RepID=UPI003CCD83F9
MTTDERRCYSHFQYYTVPSLSEFFDSPLWQELLLQMSLSEPAVYHAVVALSAIHQDLELYGMPLPGQDLQNDYHRFALDQCARSFGLLSRRNASQDPRFREVILICCLLFTFIQLLRGQYDEAFQHLRSGMKIIDEGRTRVDKQPAETCLDVTFANLEIQSLQYGVGRPLEVGNEPKLHTYSDDLGTFSNLAETRQKFDSLLREAYKFLLHAWGLSEAGVSSNYASLHEQQIQLLSQLNQFGHRFESFCLSKTFKRKERKGADMMRLVSRTLILPVKTALIRDNAALEYYVPEYETQISWVEDIMKRYPERPKVMPDIGILPTLLATPRGSV